MKKNTIFLLITLFIFPYVSGAQLPTKPEKKKNAGLTIATIREVNITLSPNDGRHIAATTSAIMATTSMIICGMGCNNCCLLAGSCAALYPEETCNCLNNIQDCIKKTYIKENSAMKNWCLNCCAATTYLCLACINSPCNVFNECKKITAPEKMYR